MFSLKLETYLCRSTYGIRPYEHTQKYTLYPTNHTLSVKANKNGIETISNANSNSNGSDRTISNSNSNGSDRTISNANSDGSGSALFNVK
jgi:hypothetical protein